MSDELRIVMATLGAISTLILLPMIPLMYKWSLLLQKIAQTVYGENGDNGLKKKVNDLDDRVDQIERNLGRRAEDHQK